jgi:cystathionine beta-lyase/cystathionine gamma-synthase
MSLVGQVKNKIVVYGGVLDPHACFLLQRGLATLALRVRQQTASALALANFLEQHPQVTTQQANDRVPFPHTSQRGGMEADGASGFT